MYYIYSTPGCSACKNAAALLEAKNLDHQVVDLLSIDIAEQSKLQSVAGRPFRTVPQIFLSQDDDLIYVGGFDNLKEFVGSADQA